MTDRPQLPVYPLPQHRSERRDAAEHRQRILEVARNLFATHGVKAVSMHQIAQVAGIGQGTLYRRYRHKGELCMDIMHESHTAFANAITAVVTDNDRPPLHNLQLVLQQLIAFFEEQGSFFESLASECMPLIQCGRPHSAQMQPISIIQLPQFRWLHSVVSVLLAEAVHRHDLAQIDVTYTADTLLAALHPGLYHFQRNERGYTPAQILAGLQQIYISGIHQPRSTPAQSDADEV